VVTWDETASSGALDDVIGNAKMYGGFLECPRSVEFVNRRIAVCLLFRRALLSVLMRRA